MVCAWPSLPLTAACNLETTPGSKPPECRWKTFHSTEPQPPLVFSALSLFSAFIVATSQQTSFHLQKGLVSFPSKEEGDAGTDTMHPCASLTPSCRDVLLITGQQEQERWDTNEPSSSPQDTFQGSAGWIFSRKHGNLRAAYSQASAGWVISRRNEEV